MKVKQENNKCQECGMECEPKEYHPYAACLMFKQTGSKAQVRGNLNAVVEYGKQLQQPSDSSIENESMRVKFDRWYASPRGEAQFELGMHYLGWAYICYAEGYKQATVDMLPGNQK